jgi:hypothetical protein
MLTLKGKRLIIVHSGGRARFISKTLHTYKSRQKTGNYHSEMDSTNYACWLKTMLIPNLALNYILVINNASYHNIQTDNRQHLTQQQSESLATGRKHAVVCNANQILGPENL